MFYFTPLPGFFSPFPRGTISLSVTQEYLVLRGGPRGFTRDFTCPMLLGIQLGYLNFQLQDSHLLWCSSRLLRLISLVQLCCPTTPTAVAIGLGSSRFARRYLGNRGCFLFLWLLRCFNSPGSLLRYWVAPFGHLRINACFQLPGAFRR